MALLVKNLPANAGDIRNAGSQTKEEEIGNLPDKEFRIMIVKLIQNLETKMESQINSLETRIEKIYKSLEAVSLYGIADFYFL